MNFNQIPTDDVIEKTKNALTSNGFNVEIVATGEDAKNRTLELIPQGSEVMSASSVTVDSIGLAKELNESGKYNSVKNQLNKLDRKTDSLKMHKLGSAPEYMVGSVHAVTQDGKVIVASNTGSQLAGYSYGATHIIWLVSAKKITTNLDEGIKRIYEYILPLESARLNKAYNITMGSNVSKLLIFNKEINPQRINLILIKEDLGF
jgi:hypothetical protein